MRRESTSVSLNSNKIYKIHSENEEEYSYMYLDENLKFTKVFGMIAIGIGTYMMIIKKYEEEKI